MSKDKHGHVYSDLIALQNMHFAIWQDRLVMPLLNDVVEYVRKHNRQANDDTQAHQVYRGQDLVQIIMDWPELKPCYPPAVEPATTAADLV